MRGVVAEGRQPADEPTSRRLASPSMEGLDLASLASIKAPWADGEGRHVVAYDYGITKIVRKLVDARGRVTVVPAETLWAEVEQLKPDGLFLSNGPGDRRRSITPWRIFGRSPATGLPSSASASGISSLGSPMAGRPPSFRMAIGAEIIRFIISALNKCSLRRKTMALQWLEMPTEVPGAVDLEVTHLNLNDGTIEGVRHRELPSSLYLITPRPHRVHTMPFPTSTSSCRRWQPRKALPLEIQDLSSSDRC